MYHFNNPNASEYGATAAGGDYYYTYGDGLFIVLNTNNYNVAEHEELIKEAVEAQMQTLEAQLSQQGLTLDMYCQFLSTTPEKLREEAEPGAIQSIRREEAIRRIVEAENIQAEQEEIARACALICQQNHITMEQLKEVYDAQLEAAVIRSVLTGKAMELVRKSAQVTEVTE